MNMQLEVHHVHCDLLPAKGNKGQGQQKVLQGKCKRKMDYHALISGKKKKERTQRFRGALMKIVFKSIYR